LNSPHPGEEPSSPRDYFATTRWTVVLAAGRSAAANASQALEELCHTYWLPLYTYVRRQGHSREDAEDLTQAFFARFLEKNYLAEVSSDRGRFRAFLLASLKHFLANEWDRLRRQKRGGGAALLSLDWQSAEAAYQFEPADHLSPDRLYDRAWAVTLLERVLGRLREENAEPGKAEFFEQLKPFLTVGKAGIPYAQVASTLGLAEGAARVAVHRLRRRYREILRDEIGQTLSDPAQIDEEMRALFDAFCASA
jgi:RNA polymerase sigma-70 factor (ECF subfamily)